MGVLLRGRALVPGACRSSLPSTAQPKEALLECCWQGLSFNLHPCGDTCSFLHSTWHPNSCTRGVPGVGVSQVLEGQRGAGLCLRGQGQSLWDVPDEGGEVPRGQSPTCVLMGKLAGPVVPAALRGQPVDEVFLVESIPYPGKHQVVQVPNGLKVGLGVPERGGCRRDWMEGGI